jgi:hypothetical protein
MGIKEKEDGKQGRSAPKVDLRLSVRVQACDCRNSWLIGRHGSAERVAQNSKD